jgi:XTP/dITP diphosphohydrolase
MLAPEWVVASDNAGKLAEIRAALAACPITLYPQADFGVASADETASTFVENALIKARHAATVTGLPAIADDSGLCVDALAGAPGLLSSRYAGADASDADNIDKLLSTMARVPWSQRTAHFYCVIVAVDSPRDPAPYIATGRWLGHLATAPAGSRGFGYDPVFVDVGTSMTAAELSATQKNRLSHRGQDARTPAK